MTLNRKNWRLFFAAYLLIGYNRVLRLFGKRTYDRINTAMVNATVNVLRDVGWRVVKFDPNTEPAERPIVVDELTP
jgi:hypothetical protein